MTADSHCFESSPLVPTFNKDTLLPQSSVVEGMRDAGTALGWPARAGKIVLTLALDRIAAYYRIA